MSTYDIAFINRSNCDPLAIQDFIKSVEACKILSLHQFGAKECTEQTLCETGLFHVIVTYSDLTESFALRVMQDDRRQLKNLLHANVSNYPCNSTMNRLVANILDACGAKPVTPRQLFARGCSDRPLFDGFGY